MVCGIGKDALHNAQICPDRIWRTVDERSLPMAQAYTSFRLMFSFRPRRSETEEIHNLGGAPLRC
jgi:hypothetical protein